MGLKFAQCLHANQIESENHKIVTFNLWAVMRIFDETRHEKKFLEAKHFFVQ